MVPPVLLLLPHTELPYMCTTSYVLSNVFLITKLLLLNCSPLPIEYISKERTCCFVFSSAASEERYEHKTHARIQEVVRKRKVVS